MNAERNETVLIYFPSFSAAAATYNILKESGIADVSIEETLPIENADNTPLSHVYSLSSATVINTPPCGSACRWLLTITNPTGDVSEAIDIARNYGALFVEN